MPAADQARHRVAEADHAGGSAVTWRVRLAGGIQASGVLCRMRGPAGGVPDVACGSSTGHGIAGFAGPGYDLPFGIAGSAVLVAPATGPPEPAMTRPVSGGSGTGVPVATPGLRAGIQAGRTSRNDAARAR